MDLLFHNPPYKNNKKNNLIIPSIPNTTNPYIIILNLKYNGFFIYNTTYFIIV